MSLILKQETAVSIPSPPAGKGTLFINDSAALSIKNPAGDVAIYPTASGSNTQVYFNDSNTINGNSNLTFTKTTGTLATVALTVTANGTFGNINISGTGTATRFISNIATGTAPLTVTSTTRVSNLNVDYANVADFISVAAGTGNNYIIFANAATGNITEVTSTGLTANLSNNSITATTFVGALSGAATSATTAGTVTTNAQGNITSVGTLSSLTVTGTTTSGNLATAGNITASFLVSNVATGTAPLTVTSTTRVANLNVAYSNVSDFGAVTSQNTGTFYPLMGSATSGNLAHAANANLSFNAATGNLSTTILNANGNANVGNLGTGGLIVATGNVTGGNLTTGGIVSATGNVTTAARLISTIADGTAPIVVTSTTRVANLNVNYANVADFINTSLVTTGTYYPVLANATSGNVADGANANLSFNVATGNLSTTLLVVTSNANVGNLGTGGLITATGNVSGGNLTTGGVVAATGNVTGANIVSSAYVISSVGTAISAAGSTQGTGTALTKNINVVSTVLTGNGVVLPTAIAGMRITVLNTSANTLAVYPAVNGIINAQAANAAYSAPAGSKLDFVSTTTTQWYTLNATYN
jgi:hypothetical protein